MTDEELQEMIDEADRDGNTPPLHCPYPYSNPYPYPDSGPSPDY